MSMNHTDLLYERIDACTDEIFSLKAENEALKEENNALKDALRSVAGATYEASVQINAVLENYE
jgi:FtsZ-binding cell division protein ZapB